MGSCVAVFGFQDIAALQTHAVWETVVIAEIHKRMQAALRPGALWFWRTAQGDEVDLLIERGPGQFMAVECKAAERVDAGDLRGIRKLAEEYGARAVTAARVVCLTRTPYRLGSDPAHMAVPLSAMDLAS